MADMSVPRRESRVRLWLVSLTLFVAGFAARLFLEGAGEEADMYPAAVAIQYYAYFAGLVTWAAWMTFQAGSSRAYGFGCLGGIALAVFSLFAVISSIPK